MKQESRLRQELESSVVGARRAAARLKGKNEEVSLLDLHQVRTNSVSKRVHPLGY